jgi:hypothetical protein
MYKAHPSALRLKIKRRGRKGQRACRLLINPKWFDEPFGRLTVLSKVVGLTVLSKVVGLTVLSKVVGLTTLSSVEGQIQITKIPLTKTYYD